jgi:hypothetical protein
MNELGNVNIKTTESSKCGISGCHSCSIQKNIRAVVDSVKNQANIIRSLRSRVQIECSSIPPGHLERLSGDRFQIFAKIWIPVNSVFHKSRHDRWGNGCGIPPAGGEAGRWNLFASNVDMRRGLDLPIFVERLRVLIAVGRSSGNNLYQNNKRNESEPR